MNKPIKWTLIGLGIFVGVVIVGFFGSAIVMGIIEAEKDIKEVSKAEEEIIVSEEKEKITKVEETKNYALDFIRVKRLKKEFADSLLKAFNSIDENNEKEFNEQMRIIDNILTELEMKKKIGVNKEVEELYDLFIEDIKTTVDMLVAEFNGYEEYEELHKKVMELDEKFLNEYHRIENKLKE